MLQLKKDLFSTLFYYFIWWLFFFSEHIRWIQRSTLQSHCYCLLKMLIMMIEKSHCHLNFQIGIFSNKQQLFSYVFLIQNKISSTFVRSSHLYPYPLVSRPLFTHSFMFRNLACSGAIFSN